MPTAPSRPTTALATVSPFAISNISVMAPHEEDMLDLVTPLREDRVLIERYRFQLGRQNVEVRRRQGCYKTVTSCARTRQWVTRCEAQRTCMRVKRGISRTAASRQRS